MDMRVVVMPKISHRVLLSLSCCTVPLFSLPVHAKDFLCDATQASSNQLPVLDKACPIGQGLWGNSAPKKRDSNFWIQCGLLKEPLPVDKAKVLYQKISTDVWMKPEQKGQRCLIGPYTDYAQAKKDLAGVRSVPGYKEAFIREVRKNGSEVAGVAAPVKKPAPKPAPKAEKVVKATPVKVAPVAAPVTKPAAPAPTGKTLQTPPKAASSGGDVVIRHQTVLNGLTYVVPYTMADNVQFYMEHNLAWNRLSYDDAEKLCRSQSMRLATEEEWKQLLSSKVMEKEQWPVYLPYWGFNKKGLFTSGKITNLKGTSLLNVLCVK
ncbi:SPOR domain-containing protein [Vibrio fluvialis]|uniref:SPOR domain-containing protein n=1 Tax=Vibrio fluvialis TaxID=676 RepID=UPI001302C20E|nr:SPOR domain-containing protein [Vibrio fluvialis]EKO3514516.1 SPOR domain-containing protein [Vibrio fluvialis]MBY8275789.1 SPOR domain-containing protein [Vibrio fluvialis]MCE7608108.1 SPOR domain-containing protein [Vibrio fluvialis]